MSVRSAHRKVSLLVVAMLIGGMAVLSPSSPASALTIGPSNLFNLYLPYWAEGTGVGVNGAGQLSTTTVPFDGWPYQFAVAQTKIHYQGAESNPTRLPAVGQRFYLHVQLALAPGMVPSDSAAFQAQLLLPTGLALPSPLANDDVRCGTTDFNLNVTSFGVPSWCADPYPFGVYTQFNNITLRGGEIAHYYVPVIASKTAAQGLGSISFIATQVTNSVGALPNPIISAITPQVVAASGTSLPTVTKPGAPTAVGADASDGGALVRWGPPPTNGGAAISNYTAYAYTAASGGTLAASCSGGSGFSCNLSGLTNGRTYFVEVKATNSAGTGPASSPRVAIYPASAPGVPGVPSTVGADRSVFVSWTPPATNGGNAVTGYKVEAYNALSGGTLLGSCTTTGALSCTVPSLNNNFFVYVQVQALNSIGYGAASARAVAFPRSPPSWGGAFVPFTPYRLLDTRSAGGCVAGGVPRLLTVAGNFGVPSSASSVQLNVTVTGPTAGGYLTAYPAGATRPNASNLNFTAGQTVANAVPVAVGTGGQVSFFVNAGCAHVIVDLVGFHTGGSTANGGFVAVSPVRQVDTRNAGQTPCIGTNQTRDFVVTTGLFGPGLRLLPVTVTLNVTVTGPVSGGYLTVFPSGAARPTASNLNYVAGQTVANLVRVTLGPGEKVSFFANSGCPNIVVDTLGWTASGTPVQGGFNGLAPARVVDTRSAGGCIPSGTSRDITVGGLAGVPTGVESVWLNVTAVTPNGNGYLTVWPTGDSRPTASTLNFLAGQVVPNLTPVRLGTGGKISVYSFGGCSNLVVDVVGYTNPVLYAVFF
jgi:hypothetical protein